MKTIVILIADYELKVTKGMDKYHTCWKLREEDYVKTILTNKLELHIISLEKFEKMQEREEIKKDDKLAPWVKFIKSPEELEEAEMRENEMVKDAYKELTKIQQDERERWLAEQRLAYMRDKKGAEMYGREEGLKEGRKERIERTD